MRYPRLSLFAAAGLMAAGLAAPVFAQNTGLIGLEVRSQDRNQVLGEVLEIRNDLAIVQLETHDQAVAIELDRLQRNGNTLTLPMNEDELAELPPVDIQSPAR
jgi:vacuolar-type H+-ATPase subunit B/Vma2